MAVKIKTSHMEKSKKFLQANTLINKRFSILYLIGKGSFADVYIGLDTESQT